MYVYICMYIYDLFVFAYFLLLVPSTAASVAAGVVGVPPAAGVVIPVPTPGAAPAASSGDLRAEYVNMREEM